MVESTQKLIRSQVAERLVRTDAVIRLFPGPQQSTMLGQHDRDFNDVIKLFLMGAVSALDVRIELRAARGEHKQVDTAGLAGAFKRGFELAAAVDLDPADRKPEAGEVVREHVLRHPAGLTVVDGEDVLAADHIAGGEMDAAQAGEHVDRRGIELDQIPRTLGDVIPGFAPRVGPRPAPFRFAARPDHSRLAELSDPTQARQSAADGGRRHDPSLALQQGGELQFAPAGILLAERADAGDERGSGLGLADAARPAGVAVIFEALQTAGIEAAPPAVESGRADAKVPAGQPGIAAMGEVEVDPAQTLAGLSRQGGRNADASAFGEDDLLDIHGASVAPADGLKAVFVAQHSQMGCFGSI